MNKYKILIIFILLLFGAGCDPEDGDTGADGRPGIDAEQVVFSIFPINGAPCEENGGNELNVGLDNNTNGVLDANEITDSFTVCNGEDGMTGMDGEPSNPILVEIEDTAPGDCPDNITGSIIIIGLDENSNGLIDLGEELDRTIVCDGEVGGQGNPGDPGMDGGQGNPGNDGMPGADGLNSLIETTVLPQFDLDCPAGGILVESGLDISEDGILDPGEVTDTDMICLPVPPEICDNGVDDDFDGAVDDADQDCQFQILNLEVSSSTSGLSLSITTSFSVSTCTFTIEYTDVDSNRATITDQVSGGIPEGVTEFIRRVDFVDLVNIDRSIDNVIEVIADCTRGTEMDSFGPVMFILVPDP